MPVLGPTLEWSLLPVTFINWLISERHPFAPAALKALGPQETPSQSQGKGREFFLVTIFNWVSACCLFGCIISTKLRRVGSRVKINDLTFKLLFLYLWLTFVLNVLALLTYYDGDGHDENYCCCSHGRCSFSDRLSPRSHISSELYEGARESHHKSKNCAGTLLGYRFKPQVRNSF